MRKGEAETAVLEALEKAALATVENIKNFDTETNVLLACDVSGSMFQPVSERSSIELIDIGILLASILRTKCENVQSGIFGDTWKTIETPEASVLRGTIDIRKREGEVGYSTNGYRVINWLARNKIRMDKVMFFTDCQLWNSTGGYGSIASSWKKYKAMFPEAKLYIFDLAGYGHSPLRLAQKDVYLIAGWSDKIFNVLEALEKGKDVLDRVNQIEL